MALFPGHVRRCRGRGLPLPHSSGETRPTASVVLPTVYTVSTQPAETERGKPRPYQWLDAFVLVDYRKCAVIYMLGAGETRRGRLSLRISVRLFVTICRGRACPARNGQPIQNPILLPHRKQLRLRGCDYAFPGVYFVTICSAGKRPVFGSIRRESIVLSPAGEIVRSEWIALAERFARLVLDEFVIMPNHLHGVLAFVGGAGGASPSPTLFDVIGSFKSLSTIKIKRLLRRRGIPLSQRSYYEHIVRAGEDLRKIQRYISENPLMWSLDPENPNRKSS